MSDITQQWRDAIADAKQRESTNIKTLFRTEGVPVNGKGDPLACPFCGAKNKFGAFQPDGPAGPWLFKCFKPDCEANKAGDEVKFLMMRRGLDFKEASRLLLEMAGIPIPSREREEAGSIARRHENDRPATPPTEPAAEEDLPAPAFIRIPDLGRNPYEEAWSALTLSQSHRAELRTKRGMPDSWIDALGFRTATPANATLLGDILNQFPPNVLLRSGIAQRDPRDHTLRLADSLLGRFYNEETERYETQDTIIIPYVDGAGRITLLRPHKRSMTNKRWREREAVSAFYEKLHNNLRLVFGEHLISGEREEAWKYTAVICEGEFKAMALRMCSIPAIAFQGIHFFLQNAKYRQAIQATADVLRKHGIRQVIVVFDNEDKSHKDFHERFEAELYARYTAECMENAGFDALHGMLPDDWREGGTTREDGTTAGGKADWDSRLAWHVRKTKTRAAGIAKAAAEFAKLLNNRNRKDSPIRKVERQVGFLDAKEDVINQGLHRLRHVPKLFKGGADEIQLAAEIQNHVPEEYAHLLKVPQLCDALRACHGGYYKTKAPSDKMVETCTTILTKAKEKIEEIENIPTRDDATEERIRALRATVLACNTILYNYPKPFTDFTAESFFKVLVTLPDGGTRQDRLIVFKDSNGVKSKPCQLSSEMMRSAQELRRFFLAMGHYHWSGGQDECDLWCHDIDARNYQKLIEEIDTYGWHRDGRFYLLGDCAVLEGGRFKFPDHNGIIWVNGTGYRNSDNMGGFTTKPPILFPDCKDPKAAYEAIDWEQERREIEPIWQQLLADYAESFGGYAGYGLVSGLVQYLAHPEILREIGFKPGLWVQGEKGSGKTKSLEFAMRMVGFPRDYGYISLGSTKVGVERSLSQFSCIPFHVDEFRNENADAKLLDLLRNAFNEISSAKGTPNGNKAIRKSTPLTIPIVSGEDGTTDSATRSRYLRIIASSSFDQKISDGETDDQRDARRLKENRKRDERFFRIMAASEQYYRIGRYLFKHREKFAELTVHHLKQFAASRNVMDKIQAARARQVFGVFFGALCAAQRLITDSDKLFPAEAMNWFVNHGAESSDDTEKDVFRRQFFQDCITMIELNEPGVNKLIRVRAGCVSDNLGIQLYSAINEPGRLFVLIAANGLYDQYLAYKKKRGLNAPIAKTNIMAELRTQPAWISPPKNRASRQFRFGIPGEKNSMNTWWVLDYKKLEPEMRQIFDVVLEMELSEVGLELSADGSIAGGEQIQF
jgi:hypothetical protein